ncbi:copper chaperone PCu(A)C [Streptomyces sp. NPDC059740]|uniref:copper chaperone PCu(A)C n=1 Tax=Streptomyces sp. NPDC059740 TaxID=3346926 RepID=UPI00364B2BB1
MTRRRTLAPALLALAVGLTTAGCSTTSEDHAAPPHLTVSGAYLPQPVNRDMAAGFLDITNSGGTADKLTSVTSDVAGDVTIHRTKGGAMQQVSSLPVPAHGRLALAHGGNHLMLMNLRRTVVEGDQVTFALHFAKSRPVTVKVPVRSATYVPPTSHS